MDEKQKRNNDINQEIMAYSEYIDNLLGHITELTPKYLPVSNSDNKQDVKVNDLLDSLRDGILFGYILNQINPKSINLDKLNRDIDLSSFDDAKSVPTTTDRAKVVFKVTANHNIILESAKKCGIIVVNIGSEDILQKNVGLVLGLLWQMIRCILLSEINIDSHPELILLLDPDESLEMAGQLSNEQLLLRWFNFHLKKNGANTISNFSKDISDSEAYFNLFERLNMIGSMNDEVMSLINQGRALPKSEKEKRAENVLKISEIMDCKRFININRIVNGHPKLNLSFVATIFNKYSDVNLTDDESMEYVRELIRRMRLKDKEHYLPLDQEIEYIRKIMASNNYLTSEFVRLYADRLNQIGWLNEYALDDTFEKPKEEAILKEMSEIERRDKMIAEMKEEIEEKNKTIEEMTSKNASANQSVEQYTKETEELKSDVKEKNTKIEEMTKTIEERDEKIKEMEELNAKQKETFKTFKKEVTEQLRLIETMMKKDMTQINKRDMDNGFESMENIDDDESQQSQHQEENNNEENSASGSGSGNENEVTDSLSNLTKDISNLAESNNLNETYKKVENYVKRLLEELKKSKEQNYIYKSQIAQNDKINALLNEKIYQYSENACKESNSSVTLKTKANSKGNLAGKKKFVPS
eukprot:jgi/Orpsp1_1/1185109/evm.model.c7180000092353.1